MAHRKTFVALAGNIGTGKTTAAELITNHFGFDLFMEPVVENRFLRLYYHEMTRWSFTLQMEFLLKRIEHQAQIERLHRSCVQDRSLIEDPDHKTQLKSLLAFGLLPSSEERAKTLFERRADLPSDPWIGRAFAHAALDNAENYLQELLTNKEVTDLGDSALFGKLETTPEYLVLREFLMTVESNYERAFSDLAGLPGAASASGRGLRHGSRGASSGPR